MRNIPDRDRPYLQAVSTYALMRYGFQWSIQDLQILMRDNGRYLISHAAMRPYVFYTHYNPRNDAYLVEAYKRHTSRALPSAALKMSEQLQGRRESA